VRQQDEDDLKKAEKLVVAAREKERRQVKNMHEAAAKLGRRLRLEGKLGPMTVYETDKPVREMKRA
jgi:hypothetical protein